MSLREILALIAQHDEDLRALGVRELALFGSHARGDADDASDLDFFVDLDPKSFDGFMSARRFVPRDERDSCLQS